jgi:hypothetical protein
VRYTLEDKVEYLTEKNRRIDTDKAKIQYTIECLIDMVRHYSDYPDGWDQTPIANTVCEYANNMIQANEIMLVELNGLKDENNFILDPLLEMYREQRIREDSERQREFEQMRRVM